MKASWVCLMYHDVLLRCPPSDGSPEFFGVSHDAFREHLDVLQELGVAGCSLAQALDRRGENCVAITFDDGNLGQYERAFPALLERGMTATFFIPTTWVGRPNFVTWDHLREMKAAGMSIQSHTRTHAYFSEIDAGTAREELVGSKAELDEALEQDTNQIALPGGFEPRSALWALIQEAGYRVAATSRWGVNAALSNGRDGPLRVRRCWALGDPARDEFRRIATGDRRLAARQWARRAALEPLKSLLGAHRYLEWRGRFLNLMGRREDELE